MTPAVRLSFSDNGPILVEVDVPTTVRRDGRIETVDSLTMALCRCGHSETKPYCDGTHRRAGFLAAAAEVTIDPGPPVAT